ncbi:unnamed protein product [Euphydryas editha]|uniref:THAP-type domain-containing protein n=1 Tax=Euphydryas editha TaxID=104508 RepID=A0AAU9TA57_EUPED|nr:unnamed protein product [Euphydryas editha]
MADKENRRKCFKCSSSPVEDGVKLFRFPNPGTRNLFRCESWARYVFPDRNCTIEVQKKLYSEHRMLCQRHFKDEDFADGDKKCLLRTAIPCDKLKKTSKCKNYQKKSPTFAILLQGQIKNSKCHLRGRRWSKEEIITALRIFKRSPTCYRLLRRLFTLPSPSTLKNILNKQFAISEVYETIVPFSVRLNEPMFKTLRKFVNTQKHCGNEYILMFDEMSMKKKNINYECKCLAEGLQDHSTQGRSGLIASYALVFMIGGIRKKVKQLIAHYFSSGFATADRLAVLIKEVLHQFYKAGVNIAVTVCYMDGVNGRALSILGASTEHPYITMENRKIVVMLTHHIYSNALETCF